MQRPNVRVTFQVFQIVFRVEACEEKEGNISQPVPVPDCVWLRSRSRTNCLLYVSVRKRGGGKRRLLVMCSNRMRVRDQWIWLKQLRHPDILQVSPDRSREETDGCSIHRRWGIWDGEDCFDGARRCATPKKTDIFLGLKVHKPTRMLSHSIARAGMWCLVVQFLRFT